MQERTPARKSPNPTDARQTVITDEQADRTDIKGDAGSRPRRCQNTASRFSGHADPKVLRKAA